MDIKNLDPNELQKLWKDIDDYITVNGTPEYIFVDDYILDTGKGVRSIRNFIINCLADGEVPKKEFYNLTKQQKYEHVNVVTAVNELINEQVITRTEIGFKLK